MKIISDLGIEIDTSVRSEDIEVEVTSDYVEETEDNQIRNDVYCDDNDVSYDSGNNGSGIIDIGYAGKRSDSGSENRRRVPDGTYKLIFSSDFEYQSRWHIRNENDEIVYVVDKPIISLKRPYFNVYEGNMKNLVGRITDPINNPFGLKDEFGLELHGESFGKVVMRTNLSHLKYKSKTFNIELRAGIKDKMYKNNRLIAEGKVHFLQGITITYWDKAYEMEIIMVYFCHVLNMYKRREKE